MSNRFFLKSFSVIYKNMFVVEYLIEKVLVKKYIIKILKCINIFSF